jgi:hypothetical protein
MNLYELMSPVEHKYGGFLTEEQSVRCVRQTELNSPRWSPYPMRLPQVENICGKFVVRVAGSTAMERGGRLGEEGSGKISSVSGGEGSGREVAEPETPLVVYTSCLNNQQVAIDPRLGSVCFKTDSPFGRQQEMFHVSGHVTVRCTPGLPRSMIFKGARGVEGVSQLIQDLFLDGEKTIPLVHMGVISSCIGVRLQTSQCCYLENRVLEGCGAMHGGWMSVETRSPDQCNIVRLSVKDWTGLLLPAYTPASNDIVITGKGSVVHRFSWTGLPWNFHVEQEVLGACESVASAIASVC